MTATRAARVAGSEEWLSVQDACSMLGVSPATLRRWSAAGDVQAFTTPGGHRRFARSTILGLLPAGPRQRPSLERLGETPERVTRMYRRRLAQACRGVDWLGDLRAEDADEARRLGRTIASSLLVLVDESRPEPRRRARGQALVAAAEYGRLAARAHGDLSDAVEVFLRFRRLFVDELAEVSRRRGLDTTESTALLVAATDATDELLAALMRGHESARGATGGAS